MCLHAAHNGDTNLSCASNHTSLYAVGRNAQLPGNGNKLRTGAARLLHLLGLE
jgi:hypothetical protein